MEKKITFTDDVLNMSNDKLEKIFENSGNVIPADWSKYIATNKYFLLIFATNNKFNFFAKTLFW